MPPVRPTPDVPVLSTRRGRLALIAAAAGVFMLNLDVTIVAVAVASLQTAFDTSTSTVQWVISAYLLALAGWVVTMGRLGDAVGRRRVFVGGVVAFTITSVLAGVAPSMEWLIAARVLQGVSAAAVQALSLALIADVFPAGERARAIGLWSAVATVSVAVGPVLGGVIVETLGWRWIFFLNVPIGALVATLAVMALPDNRGATRGFDGAGFATSVAGITLLLVAITQGRAWGWGSATTLAVLAGAAVLLAAFVAIELRVRAPIADLRLLRIRAFLGTNVGMIVSRGSYYAMFFLIPLALQRSAGLTPTQTGLVMLPMVVAILIGSPVAGALSGRVGALRLIAIGMVVNAVGIGLLAVIDIDGSLAPVIGALIVFAIGSAAVYAPINAIGISAVPEDEVGDGSGIMAMVRYVSAAIAVAAAVTVLQVASDGGAGARVSEVTVAGFHATMAILAVLAAVGGAGAIALLRGAGVPRR